VGPAPPVKQHRTSDTVGDGPAGGYFDALLAIDCVATTPASCFVLNRDGRRLLMSTWPGTYHNVLGEATRQILEA
jgi:hypothetical protein